MRQALQEAEDLEVTVRLRNILKKISPLRPGTDSTEIK